MRLGIAGFTVLFVFGFFCAAQAAPVVSIDDAVWNAGIIVSGKTYKKTIVIENVGNEPLVIEKIEECCGFFGEVNGVMRLAPGEKAPLLLTLAPFKFSGELKAEMFVVSNDPGQPRYSVFAVAQVVPNQHALGELKASEIDLGVIDVRDRVPFAVHIASVGNVPLLVRQIDKPVTINESGFRPEIAPGSDTVLTFEYAPLKPGPIEDKIVIGSNDSLNKVLVFQVKGYVASNQVSQRALSIYPIMGGVSYDVMTKSYKYDFTISNNGPVSVYMKNSQVDLPKATLEIPDAVRPGESVNASVTIPLEAARSGAWAVDLHLRLPFEVQ